MSRVKTGVSSRRRRKRVMKLAEGYRGARRKRYRTAKEAVQTALNYAYRDRKVRKREFRSLWIARINAACRINDISYSRFISGLKKVDLALNRKILAELAVSQPEKFSQITKIAMGYLQ